LGKSKEASADIKAINPDDVIPLHCSGWEAVTMFERKMPKQFIIHTAGTQYTFAA
jgi:7,8-dihydropterin-6-yl-methyl-4-(beta-D-ribofuranosyl)aminobenzene 5'-phosphate synthase